MRRINEFISALTNVHQKYKVNKAKDCELCFLLYTETRKLTFKF